MMEDNLDLYTDYLLSSFGQASSTVLSRLLDEAVSHDKISRFLSGNEFGPKALWQHVKPLVRKYQTDDACLIFDDIIVAKPHTDENELICWHFDHSEGRTVKGFNILNAYYHSQSDDMGMPLRVPVGFEIILKSIQFCDIKTRKEKRISPVTKNETLRAMVEQAIHNQLKFKYVLADSCGVARAVWFGREHAVHR